MGNFIIILQGLFSKTPLQPNGLYLRTKEICFEYIREHVVKIRGHRPGGLTRKKGGNLPDSREGTLHYPQKRAGYLRANRPHHTHTDRGKVASSLAKIQGDVRRFSTQEFDHHRKRIQGHHLRTRKKVRPYFVGQPLSNVDGINTIEALRADGLNTDTPIIFSWEGMGKTLLQRTSSIGATGFLQKQIEEIHFRRLFEIVLNKYVVSFDDERERAHEAMKPMVQATEFAKNIRLQGDYEAAETAFKTGLIELFCGLAEVYLSGGNPSYANRVLAQAERIDPNARTRFDVREETFIERGKKYIEKKIARRSKSRIQSGPISQ
ncbi:MAG: hypothetical protein QF787_11715 [Nitrospinota bacterium]|nr:hypothetical protein [Nitrospinota bacterium]